eukprot:TRINITY_DN68183_c4_g3_i1.p1 TRINITY_DN68183_c4_g3~~TRINITY_DN68183_c4_g3_i1.p1  ORF type:complete len:438 (-),score=-3.99 TRINITY_DN68183_c4_g3_i1:1058-2371(-)
MAFKHCRTCKMKGDHWTRQKALCPQETDIYVEIAEEITLSHSDLTTLSHSDLTNSHETFLSFMGDGVSTIVSSTLPSVIPTKHCKDRSEERDIPIEDIQTVIAKCAHPEQSSRNPNCWKFTYRGTTVVLANVKVVVTAYRDTQAVENWLNKTNNIELPNIVPLIEEFRVAAEARDWKAVANTLQQNYETYLEQTPELLEAFRDQSVIQPCTTALKELHSILQEPDPSPEVPSCVIGIFKLLRAYLWAGTESHFKLASELQLATSVFNIIKLPGLPSTLYGFGLRAFTTTFGNNLLQQPIEVPFLDFAELLNQLPSHCGKEALPRAYRWAMSAVTHYCRCGLVAPKHYGDVITCWATVLDQLQPLQGDKHSGRTVREICGGVTKLGRDFQTDSLGGKWVHEGLIPVLREYGCTARYLREKGILFDKRAQVPFANDSVP